MSASSEVSGGESYLTSVGDSFSSMVIEECSDGSRESDAIRAIRN